MINYFKYELKKNAYALGCITVILSIIYVLPILTIRQEYISASINLAEISTIGGVLAAALPVWIYKYRTKRRIVDLYYALPLSHTKIFITEFLFGLVALYLPYTVAYWLGALTTISKAGELINGVWYLPQYFASLIPIYCIYAMTTFIFTRANTVKDGVVFVIFWAFALCMFLLVIVEFTNDWFSLYYFLPFAPLDTATSYFIHRIKNVEEEFLLFYYEPDYVAMAIGFTVTALLTAGATAGVILSERFTKGENAGQISDSWFGYRVMIPYYTVCILWLIPLDSSLTAILVVLVVIGAYLLTASYRRTLKIGKNQLIILGASILAGIVLSLICN